MSEYQYYEFLAIDRPLTERQMGELRDISTRAEITPTSFINTYEWGDLKARPINMMAKYFDAFVYVANWGKREFMMRLPHKLLDPKTIAAYRAGNTLSYETKGAHLIVSFLSDQEPGDDWEGGEGRLSSLVALRADLLGGDLRCLYLGWLLAAQMEELKDGSVEPPVPPDLGKLSGPLSGLADFLQIDPELIEVAASASAPAAPRAPAETIRKALASLSAAQKDEFLTRLALGEEQHVRVEVLQRLRQRHDASEAPAKRRTVAALLTAAAERTTAKRQAAAERAVRERARRDEEQAAARSKYLDGLAGREEDIWKQIDGFDRHQAAKEIRRGEATAAGPA